jgi:hypothetical protein
MDSNSLEKNLINQNMDKLILSLCLFASILAYSQEYNFDEIVTVDGKTSLEIHQKTEEWIALTFVSSKESIDMNTEKQIVVKGKEVLTYSIKFQIDDFYWSTPSSYDMNLIISFREGRYRFQLILSQRKIKNFSEPYENLIWSKLLDRKEYDSITDLDFERMTLEVTNEIELESLNKVQKEYNYEEKYRQYLEEWNLKTDFVQTLFESHKTYVFSVDDNW